MTNHEFKLNSSNHLRGALIMGAVSVGGLVEAARARHEKKQPNDAGFISYFEDDGPSNVFFKGCGENIVAQAPLLHRKLGGYGSMHFEYQMSGKHSQELIDQNLIKTLKSDGMRDRIFWGTSMGLMNALRSLENPAVLDAIGEDRLLALVSLQGITCKADLQPDMQRAAEIASDTPNLPFVGDLWRIQRLYKAHVQIAHGPGTTDAETILHNESSAFMRPSLVFSQYEEINQSKPFTFGSHQPVIDRNPGVHLFEIVPEYDSVADHELAKASLERAFSGLPVETITDERRAYGDHANNLEYFEPIEELMMKLTGIQSNMALAARNLVAFSSGRGFALAS